MFKYVKQTIHRFSRRNDPDFPNKCDICGLRAQYPSTDKGTDERILKAGELQQCGLATSYSRNIHISVGAVDKIDFTFFCALSNIKYWNKPFKKCPDWQLHLGNQLTLSDHLAVHHSKNNTRIAIKLGILASLLTILGISVGLCTSP